MGGRPLCGLVGEGGDQDIQSRDRRLEQEGQQHHEQSCEAIRQVWVSRAAVPFKVLHRKIRLCLHQSVEEQVVPGEVLVLVHLRMLLETQKVFVLEDEVEMAEAFVGGKELQEVRHVEGPKVQGDCDKVDE